jgi:hypothetical protein
LPTATPLPEAPADTPTVAPQEVTTEAPTATLAVPAEPAQPPTETATPLLPVPSPTPRPEPEPEPAPDAGGGQSIINWVKFWDTIAVVVAYPWLCCGIGLLLLVPVFLLFLEIKGRRPPRRPPEPVRRKRTPPPEEE